MTEIGSNNPEFVVSLPGRADAQIRLAWAASTDVGKRRSANEDSYVAQSPVFAVADGMGGHAAGDLASAAVVRRLAETNSQDFTVTEVIDRALEAATDDIELVSVDSELGVGTTATGAVLTMMGEDPYFAVFNVGDSRVYAFEGGRLHQVTVDHSVVQEMVDAGMISRAQAEHHPDNNIITRAVGFGAPPTADYWMLPLAPGVRLLICSDGLNKELSDDDVRDILAAGDSADETVTKLVNAALDAGGRDNVTVIVVDVLEAPINHQHDIRTGETDAVTE
ncbi:MAG TPA: protein phosphatase 2C domain-containing protein [Glaciihabitans sp.]|nr:protein phosphatase 2C domain-containing protein [Glaciihabitans sp.]